MKLIKNDPLVASFVRKTRTCLELITRLLFCFVFFTHVEMKFAQS